MFRRWLYMLLLVLVAAGLWIKGNVFLQSVRAGTAGTTGGLLQLAYLLTMVALEIVIVRTLLQSGWSRREALATSRSSANREVSLPEGLVRLRTVARRAFVRHAVLSIALLLVLAVGLGSIPIILLTVKSAGGPETFGPMEWLVVGLTELPVVFLVVLIAIGFLSKHDSSL